MGCSGHTRLHHHEPQAEACLFWFASIPEAPCCHPVSGSPSFKHRMVSAAKSMNFHSIWVAILKSLLFVQVWICTECVCQKFTNVFRVWELQINVCGPVCGSTLQYSAEPEFGPGCPPLPHSRALPGPVSICTGSPCALGNGGNHVAC